MRQVVYAASFALMAWPAFADTVGEAVETHILPGYTALAENAEALATTAQQGCAPDSVALRAAYGAAFDAWVGVSHLRFGPSEKDNRAFALAFWPDPRGTTSKTLSALIQSEDPIGLDPTAYKDVSVAARGFYALEFLLYDETLSAVGNDAYRCALVQTISTGIADVADALLQDWQDTYADALKNPAQDGPYRTPLEAKQELFKALSTGLEFTSQTRLGRPLGTFDRPRPKRAEARRSGRSAHHVALSLSALKDLAVILAAEDAELAETLSAAFERASARVARLDDPAFEGVAQPQSRIRVEEIQVSVETIRNIVTEHLGPTLGVTAGFNALDGD